MPKNPILVHLIFLFSSGTVLFAQISPEKAIEAFAVQSGIQINEVTESTEIAAHHISSTSGVHHFYLRQHIRSIPIYNAIGSIHFSPDGKPVKYNSDFIPSAAELTNSSSPRISARQAVRAVVEQMNYEVKGDITRIAEAEGPEQMQFFRNSSISQRDIIVQLMYQPVSKKEIRISWNFNLEEPSGENWWDFRVDAETGEILDKTNWIVNCRFSDEHKITTGHHGHGCSSDESLSQKSSSAAVGGYRVYPYPVISPADGNRQLISDPDDATASPYGWHDTNGAAGAEFTITRGNNAHAYDDGDNVGFSPDGGAGLVFDFPIDTFYTPGNPSEPAAITNLFYWNNIIHDMMYHYGFTEDAGNFQQNNYGNGGTGGDYVLAEAQDGSGTCNANFGTPPDGSKPRMQMFICGNRDGDLDNVVIVHEYAHGISNRLTGGPGTGGCLNNSEQMGEGWSDYFGLMMTLEPGDIGTDPVGVGCWLIGESLNCDGIRNYPYSTALAVNPQTYDNLPGTPNVHAAGEIWCTMLWEMTWALIDKHGFDNDLYFGTGGNNMALKLVVEGMKLQPCHPGFVDGRDAILLADQMLYNGENQCEIWRAFAKRGLGFSADQGSSDSRTDGTAAFDMPNHLEFDISVDKELSIPGDTLTYTLTAKNPTFCDSFFAVVNNLNLSVAIPYGCTYVAGSATNGGSVSGNVVSFPTVASLNQDDSISRSFAVAIDPVFNPDSNNIIDDMESGPSQWITYTSLGGSEWNLSSVNPNSANNSWFAENYEYTVNMFLELASDIPIVDGTTVAFWHDFNTEFNWDGGRVQYSLDNGNTWSDAGSMIVQNNYTGRINNSSGTPGYTGDSGGYIESIIDFTPLNGETIRLRFWMSCDYIVSDEGWYIDDVRINFGNFINTTALFSVDSINYSALKSATTELLLSSCDSLLDVYGIVLSHTYHAGEILSSDGTVPAPNQAYFKAENEVRLEPEFEVELGAELTVEIENCISTLNSIPQKPNRNSSKLESMKAHRKNKNSE